MTRSTFVLGIDQGSTQTRAAVCDGRGSIQGLGTSFGACHSIHGMDLAMQAVTEAAQSALEGAEVSSGQIEMLFAGLTGADWPDEYPLLEENLRQLGLARRVQVVNDCIVALRGGTPASFGAIVIAGTGANCAIRSPSGEGFIYHYYVEGQLQGGSALGRRVLNAIYRSATGREAETQLTRSVLAALGFSNVDELLRAHSERRLSENQIKELAPLLFQAASEGDPVARKIISGFAEGLAELVTAGLKRFDMTDLEVEVVLSGSIFKGRGTLLEDVMAAEIKKVAPGARLVGARYEPVVGAVVLGLEACGISIDGVVQKNIEESSRTFNLIRIRD